LFLNFSSKNGSLDQEISIT